MIRIKKSSYKRSFKFFSTAIVAASVFMNRVWVGVYLLLLQLSDGVLSFLKALTGRGALLPHHSKLTLDNIVLLCFLRPRHLTLEEQVRAGWRSSSALQLNFKMMTHYQCRGKGYYLVSEGVQHYYAKGELWNSLTFYEVHLFAVVQRAD